MRVQGNIRVCQLNFGFRLGWGVYVYQEDTQNSQLGKVRKWMKLITLIGI